MLHKCACLGRTDKENSYSESQSYVPVNVTTEGNVMEEKSGGHDIQSVLCHFVTQLKSKSSVTYRTLHHSHILTPK
jgi:hypothetical protein